MEKIKGDLLKRKKQLTELKKNKEASLAEAPKGAMRINTSNGSTQFYYRQNPAVRSGTYIPKKDFLFAQALAQKDYDEKVLQSIDKELRAIEQYLLMLPKTSPEQIYETLHVERQKLITPIRKTDQQYKEAWENISFCGKEIDGSVPPLYTERGEQVRSKSEVIIADILYRAGIPYRYEAPLLLKGLGMVHPDFTVLNLKERKEIYWEHLGMMDNPDYVEAALTKIQVYRENGIEIGDNLILTWETRKCPIHQKIIRKEIQKYLC